MIVEATCDDCGHAVELLVSSRNIENGASIPYVCPNCGLKGCVKITKETYLINEINNETKENNLTNENSRRFRR